MNTYKTHGTCSRQITYEVTSDNKVKNVKFIGGCMGNTQGVAKLVEGRNIDEVISLLSGIKCRGNTSCPDQLSKALQEYKQKNEKI